MVDVKAVSYQYAGAESMTFGDLCIGAGEKWLLTGESGSGKSTFLHILTGILKPASGKVTIDGTDIYSLSSAAQDRFRGRNIGIVFQQAHLIKSLTIQENLLLAQSFAGLPKNKKKVNQMLQELGIGSKAFSYPQQLSQGQLQRASIGRALINRPGLLVADEPTSSLDNRNADTVLRLLLDLSNSHNTSLLVSTHDDRVKPAFSNVYNLTLNDAR
ncbi:ABC transporter ATP-binding protein [Dyadobacter luteus]|uniref:ABC transporter ATP-binding protein n=1 Tax=Dyadobacter luteus TaxID=2259619 RepID=A0A3D8YDS0_9BACT|nr:ATP-binding cassette domain-containing protein [Dyadobacter luteus]REA62646.1 ABC transporter ATP-binding protein [Dyadobacter luteus]